MIQNIYIKDFAIMDEIDLDLKSGLTVITGETGSGKSLLLEAMGVALGGKANKLMVKNGKNRAVIEATFKENIVRRIISNNGRTKAFNNDEPISMSLLKTLTETAVDFHGQHDQQLILDVNRHIDYLDRYCGHESKVDSLVSLYDDIRNLNARLKQIQSSKQERQDRLDLLSFQANEIDSVNIELGEDETLDKSYKQLTHLEDILKTIQRIQSQITTRDDAIIDVLQNQSRSVETYAEIDDEMKSIGDYIQSAIIQLQECGTEISNKLSNSEFDPQELKEVEERLSAVESLKRKYGGAIESVLEKRESIQKEIKSLTEPEQSEDSILESIKRAEQSFEILALGVHETRIKQAAVLSKKIEDAMAKLNMSGSKFDIQISQDGSEKNGVNFNGNIIKMNPKGIDEISFYLSANPGEPVKPLASIASGGEISRIMLAIKTVFQKMDPVQTLVFDEIDSGISGVAAEKVADQLKSLSKSKQVFCITHLAQIATKADHHLHVKKSVHRGQTYVEASYLSKGESPKIIQELFIGTETLNA